MNRTTPTVAATALMGCALVGAALLMIVAGARRRPYSAPTPAPYPALDPVRGPGPVRDAGPETMRDPVRDWDGVDEASDESFPASDPPASY